LRRPARPVIRFSTNQNRGGRKTSAGRTCSAACVGETLAVGFDGRRKRRCEASAVAFHSPYWTWTLAVRLLCLCLHRRRSPRSAASIQMGGRGRNYSRVTRRAARSPSVQVLRTRVQSDRIIIDIPFGVGLRAGCILRQYTIAELDSVIDRNARGPWDCFVCASVARVD
jgi:hypothetical protein